MPRVVVNKPQPLDSGSKRELQNVQTAFGEHVRQLRHERLMTIEQLAELAGLHANYVGAVERGERNISLFNIWRISSGLGLHASDLMSSLPARKGKRIASSLKPVSK